MGRVAGLTGAIFKVGMPPVIILAGVLSDGGGLVVAFALAAAINAGAALYLAYPAGWGWAAGGMTSAARRHATVDCRCRKPSFELARQTVAPSAVLRDAAVRWNVCSASSGDQRSMPSEIASASSSSTPR